jgi:MGT family glycosyltransferase
VVEAFRQRPEYDLILHTGDLLSAKDLEPLPENVMVRGWVPQLAVLAKSRLMITHGGLGSIKECVQFRVPMVVFPVEFDQPGNAARVVFHRLGLRGDMRRATPEAIRELLDHAMTNRNVYLENLERMRGCFTDPRPLEDIMDLVEQASRGRAR